MYNIQSYHSEPQWPHGPRPKWDYKNSVLNFSSFLVAYEESGSKRQNGKNLKTAKRPA